MFMILALVYAMTTPRAYPGWQVAFDHPKDPGTLVRVRKGPITGTDRREPR